MSVKSSVLAYLESQKSSYVSGEELAARLSCSRTAVWKAIQSLRQEGYAIKAVTNKGYLLEKDSGLLSAEVISSYLSSPDIPVMVYKEVSSTNLLLRRKALESVPSLPDGSMVLAESQSAGRGHLGRGFFSPEKSGLYLSILYHPKALFAQSRLVTAAAAAAVWEAVHSVCGYDLDIKWVNDLYFQGKKVCGILTEGSSSFETGELDCIITGIYPSRTAAFRLLPVPILAQLPQTAVPLTAFPLTGTAWLPLSAPHFCSWPIRRLSQKSTEAAV